MFLVKLNFTEASNEFFFGWILTRQSWGFILSVFSKPENLGTLISFSCSSESHISLSSVTWHAFWFFGEFLNRIYLFLER